MNYNNRNQSDLVSQARKKYNNRPLAKFDKARGYKTFHAQLSMKFLMLINVKMPAIVGILTFISMINTSESLKARKVFIIEYFSFLNSSYFMLS